MDHDLTLFLKKNRRTECFLAHNEPPATSFSRQWFMPRFNLNALCPYDENLLARAHHAVQEKNKPLRCAAVLIPLIERQGEISVLLTKRASHLHHHPGQISFPGGKVEQSDRSFYHTAIRETKEEIGLTVPINNIIGSLMPLPSVSGYLITPVLGFIKSNEKATLDKNEVESLFEVPLSQLMDSQQWINYPFLYQGTIYHIYATCHQEHFIWGVTAQILDNLIKQISS